MEVSGYNGLLLVRYAQPDKQLSGLPEEGTVARRSTATGGTSRAAADGFQRDQVPVVRAGAGRSCVSRGLSKNSWLIMSEAGGSGSL